MRLSLYTAPASEPIIIADVEAHSRLGSGYIASLGETSAANIFIAAVRQKCEAITRRQLINATWDLILDRFPCGNRSPIEIPLPPLQTITSISYIDPNGDTQVLSSSLYRVITDVKSSTDGQGNTTYTATPKCQPGIVLPIVGQSWPATQDDIAVVTIRFAAGYGSAGSAVPEGIKNWMLLNIANLWENRETETMAAGRLTQIDISTLADGLLDDYRILTW
jgi:uncharacterized phiE125 gp8 family phage protein